MAHPVGQLGKHQGVNPPAPAKKPHHPAGLQTITDLERDALLQFVPGAVRLTKSPLSPADHFIDFYVMGIGSLGPGWNNHKLKFYSRDQAIAFLHDHGFNTAPGAQVSSIGLIDNALAAQWGAAGHDQPTQNDWLANELITGWAWIVPIYPPPFQNPGLGPNPSQKLILTDATVGTKINQDRGTDIDFLFTSANEGGQWQRGYVPYGYFKKTKTSHVIGASGVTIASGFDLGQQSVHAMKTAGFNQFYLDLFANYIGHPLTHDDHATACHYILKNGPMPVLTFKADADEVDRLSYLKILNPVEAAWKQTRQSLDGIKPKSGQPAPPQLKAFTDLSGAWQTVMFDYAYQHGPGGLQTSPWGRAAFQGNADEAKTALKASSTGSAANPDRAYLQWERLDADKTSLTIPATPTPTPTPTPKPTAAPEHPTGQKP